MNVVITSGSGFTGAIIRWYTWSWAAHAGIQLDDGTYIDSTLGPGVSHHPGIHGEIVRKFAIVSPSFNPSTAKLVDTYLHLQLGKPYDWTAITGMAFRRDWHRTNSWFCSELVAAAFEAAGMPLISADHLDRVTPRDLLLSPYLREVTIGR